MYSYVFRYGNGVRFVVWFAYLGMGMELDLLFGKLEGAIKQSSDSDLWPDLIDKDCTHIADVVMST